MKLKDYENIVMALQMSEPRKTSTKYPDYFVQWAVSVKAMSDLLVQQYDNFNQEKFLSHFDLVLKI